MDVTTEMTLWIFSNKKDNVRSTFRFYFLDLFELLFVLFLFLIKQIDELQSFEQFSIPGWFWFESASFLSC